MRPPFFLSFFKNFLVGTKDGVLPAVRLKKKIMQRLKREMVKYA